MMTGFARAPDGNKACALLTPAEIEAALGNKVTNWSGGAAQTSGLPGAPEFCRGAMANANIMLRLAQRAGAPGREAQGMAAAKKAGVQVEVRTFGPVTCSSLIPPKNLEPFG